ncbi:MAG: histidine kinase [Bacteroidia bacterium]|nr:histidine kinase [Bacteroidia bacterium]
MRISQLIYILLLFSSLQLTAQQYNFSRLSLEDGLAQSQVWTMLHDRRGQVWMGTRGGGISVYNGMGFKTYTRNDGLPNNHIWSIAEDSEGNIWAGTDEGLVRFNGLYFEKINPTAADLIKEIQSLAFDAGGTLWIGTVNSLVLFNGTSFRVIRDENGKDLKNVSSILHTEEGAHWVGTSDGLYECSNTGVKKRYGKKEGLLDSQIQSLCADAKGNIWIGTYGGGVYIFNGKRIYRPEDAHGLRSRIVHHLFFDSKKTVWISTQEDGLFRFNPADSSILHLTQKDGLSVDHVRVTSEDRWGNYWIGTSGGGVNKYSGQKFIRYDQGNGLPDKFTGSVLMDSEGRVWTGAGSKGICVLDSGLFRNFSSQNSFKDVKVRSILEGPGKHIWLGTEGNGIFIHDSGTFIPVRELNGKFIKDMLMDDSSRVWVATAGGGIFILTTDSTHMMVEEFQTITTRKGLPTNRINALHLDRKGRIWFATDQHGAGYIRNDSVSLIYDRSNGLSYDEINCISEDKYGNIWLGTSEKGINIVPEDGNTDGIDTIDLNDGLTGSNVYFLVPDTSGNMYVGAGRGVDYLIMSPSGKITSIRHLKFGEGPSGVEASLNAAILDTKQNLWFGTGTGLICYFPNSSIKNTVAPVLAVTGIQIFYKPVMETRFAGRLGSWFTPGLHLILNPDENHVGFEFFAVNMPAPEAVMYSWILEGMEKKWSPYTHNRNVTYSNLPPGDYTFRLKAVNEEGIESEELQSISFTVLPPFWRTWWFIALITGSGAGVIALVFYLRLSVVKRRSELLRKQLEMEKNTLELEQKALRLQMNPHFIFNALNSIQSLISQKDEKTARLYLAKFSKLMRMILDNSRQSSISLLTEIQTLEHYLSIEKFCSDDKFEYSIRCDEHIPKDEIYIPPMLLQPFVENAVIHGIRYLDRPGKITITFSLDGPILECRISDNGVGRTKAIEIRSQQAEHHKSTALIVTQERLDLLNQNSGVQSLEINDLTENGKPTGTCIVIRIKQ